MHIVYINPNATQSMTDAIVATAQKSLPQAKITGMTNTDGPPAIEGPEDGDAAIPGVLARVDQAQEMGANAIVIACFDDTGLNEARARAACPVLGIGQSAYMLATLAGGKFSVVTSVDVSIPVIEGNIQASGFEKNCASVCASGLSVLTIEEGGEDTRAHLANAISAAQHIDGVKSVILGCAGMSPLREDLAARTQARLIDGVAASAQLAAAAINGLQG